MNNERKNSKKNNTDKNASPYRNAKNRISDDTRRGNAFEKKGYGTRPVKRDDIPSKQEPIHLYENVTERDKNRKIAKSQNEMRLKKQHTATVVGVILSAVFALVLLFMTPLFNISEIRLEGNKTISKDIITAKIGNLIDTNLFGTSTTNIEKKMLEIPQISDVSVKKAVFPARLEISVTESKPAAYVLSGTTTIVVDSNLRIVDDASTFDYEKLPSISGVSVKNYEMNGQLEIDSQEKYDIILDILQNLELCNLVDKTKYISVDDITNITFNYDNRINVMCGSPLQIDRKIRLFAESIKSPDFDENSIGTMDVSVPGKGMYTPE